MHAHWLLVTVFVGALGMGCGDARGFGEGPGGASGAGGGGGADAGGGGGGGGSGGSGGTVTSALSQAEIDGLLFTREEEKLARDVYAALDGYGNPFVNIQNSEQSHMDAILALLSAYGLPDPAAGKAAGAFTNADLQALHDALVAQGSPSANAALQVGCAIEELDIRDIVLAKELVTHADILATYDTLLFGSRNHLRAFYGKLTKQGGSYAPVYVDQATFDAIVGSPMEKP